MKPDRFYHVTMNKDQQDEADKIRLLAGELENLFDKVVSSEERSEPSRLMNIARTNLEQSIMWAIKAVSRKAFTEVEK